MVLVHVYTFQLQGLSVQQESSVGIEGDGAQTGACGVDVGDPSIHFHYGLHLIEIGVGGAPEMRTGEGELLTATNGLLGAQTQLRHLAVGHLVAFTVQKVLLHGALLWGDTAVVHLGFHGQRGIGVGRR